MAAPYTDPALGLEKLHLMTERGDLNLLVAVYELGFLSLNREVRFRYLNFLKLSVHVVCKSPESISLQSQPDRLILKAEGMNSRSPILGIQRRTFTPRSHNGH